MLAINNVWLFWCGATLHEPCTTSKVIRGHHGDRGDAIFLFNKPVYRLKNFVAVIWRSHDYIFLLLIVSLLNMMICSGHNRASRLWTVFKYQPPRWPMTCDSSLFGEQMWVRVRSLADMMTVKTWCLFTLFLEDNLLSYCGALSDHKLTGHSIRYTATMRYNVEVVTRPTTLLKIIVG